jgi:DNA-binding FrmR family transcriptional regulator
MEHSNEDGRDEAMRSEYKKEAVLRLKIAAGHLESVRRMVDDEAYCVDLMKQLSAVQSSLEKVQQVFLRNHLSTCVSDAIQSGMGDEIIDELMGALKFNKSLTDGRNGVALDETAQVLAIGEGEAEAAGSACCRPAATVASGTSTTTRDREN